MVGNLKNYLNVHKKGALITFVVALFAVGAMLLGQAGYLGGNLTGDLGNSRKKPMIQAQAVKTKTPVATFGTVNVKQNVTGTVVLIDRFNKTFVSTSPYTNAMAATGNYNLDDIMPPAGYLLSTVTDASGNNVLTAPYKQTLAAGGSIGFTVNYKSNVAQTNTVVVTRNNTEGGTLTVVGPKQKADIQGGTITFQDKVGTEEANFFQNGDGSNSFFFKDEVGAHSLIVQANPGYVVESVKDMNNNVLSASYAQTLGLDNPMAYSVNFEPILGTLQINQNGGLGKISFSGPANGTVQTEISTWANNAQLGDYTLSSITPPAGYVLSDVTDMNKKPLTAPYAQTLVAGETIWYNVNFKLAPAPIATGTLNISSEGNPDSATFAEGTPMHLVSKYRISAIREGFSINTLTIINDLSGSFNFPEDTIAVNKVILTYTDSNGGAQTVSGPMFMGSTTFSKLTLNVPAGQDSYIEIFADVTPELAVGPSLIGQNFRLGLQDTNNNAKTFEAVGAASVTLISNPTISNSSSVNTFTVVGAAELTVFKAPLPLGLVNGDQTLISFNVKANDGGSVHISKMIFDVSDYGNNPPTDFRLYRDGALVLTNTSAASFVFDANNDQFVQAGSTFAYELVAAVHNAISKGSSLTTALNSGFTADAPIVGLPISHTLTY